MKMIFASLLGIILLGFPPVFAEGKYQNKIRYQAEIEALRAKIEKIPIYTEKLKGNYKIIGQVRAQDALSTKQEVILLNLKAQAYQNKADAIMEVKCKKIWKWVAQDCEGFAIRYVGGHTGE